MADQLTQEWTKLDNKVRFITEIIQGKLIVQNRKKAEIMDDLRRRGYKALSKSERKGLEKSVGLVGADENEDDNGETPSESENISAGYDYLLSMAIWNLTSEKVCFYRTYQ